MEREALTEHLKEIIGSFLEPQGLELVELICRHEGRDLVLQVLVDRPEGGITVGECSGINKEIGNLLDEKNILEGSYLLEVSSPGIDRPLKTKADFFRCIGKEVRFFLNKEVNGKLEWAGEIKKVEGETVFIRLGDVLLEIPLANINKARQEID